MTVRYFICITNSILTPMRTDRLWIREQGNIGQVIYCLTKAVKADPDDVDAKWDRASLFAEHNDYQKAAEAFEQLLLQRPSDVEVGKMVAKVCSFWW